MPCLNVVVATKKSGTKKTDTSGLSAHELCESHALHDAKEAGVGANRSIRRIVERGSDGENRNVTLFFRRLEQIERFRCITERQVRDRECDRMCRFRCTARFHPLHYAPGGGVIARLRIDVRELSLPCRELRVRPHSVL